MPTYPVAAPTLANDILTINRFLNSPTMVQRRMREIVDQQFVADQILTGKIEASGGAISYGVSESIYSDRDPAAVNPGAEYDRALTPDGAAALAKTTKYGQDVPLTDEKIGRERGRGVDQVLKKSVNRTVRFTDTITLAAVSASVTQTQAATASWATTATADPLLDVLLAQATLEDLGEGYNADIVVLTKILAARLAANSKILAQLPREDRATIERGGALTMFGDLRVIAVPAARMPPGVTAIVADSSQLGSMGWENIPSQEYTGPPDGIQTWIRRDPTANDQYLVRNRRVFVPIVQEPNAAIKITGA